MLTTRRWLALLLIPALVALIAAGCGDDGDDGDGAGTTAKGTKTPAPLKAGGDFLFCTDVPYPPAESQEGDKFVGYEIDIATEVAERLGTEARFQKTGFDGIIGALQAGKCDAVISSMNNTEERRKQVDFVDYMMVGQSLMVTPELKDEVESLDDLSGRAVAVQGATTLRDALDAKSKELEADGKDPIKVSSFPDAGAAAAALKTDKVDAFFGDSPVVADYINREPDSFAFGGEPIDPLPVGIALRKQDDELVEAVQNAVDETYDDGTMQDILDKWKISDFGLDDK